MWRLDTNSEGEIDVDNNSEFSSVIRKVEV